jgi:hypothetical protein
VHAALLPRGQVLFFAGSGSSKVRWESPQFPTLPTSVVWDPNAPDGKNFFPTNILLAADGRPYDYFCGGDSFLADGRMLSAGGTATYPFRGRAEAATFNPQTRQWAFVASMAHGRWYPSLITLGDGRILAASDLNEKKTMEIYSPLTNTWALQTFADGFAGLPLYAHLFLLADGRILFDGGRMDDVMEVAPCIIDLTQNPIHTIQVPGGSQGGMRNQSASVLLPPAQDQRVMIIGGGPPFKENQTDAIDNVDIVNLRDPHPHFVPATPLNLPRLHLNAILLPDRTVFVTGGSLKQEGQGVARLQGEIYDPTTNTWTLTAACEVPRLYHSTALLLPDGRVVTAGSNPEGSKQVPFGVDQEELRLEIYSPPYLFPPERPRPLIQAAPEDWTYNQLVDIQSPQAGTLRWAHLIKNGVTTHSFDGSQRLVDLPIASQAKGIVRVQVTDNPNIAPSGWYMLFIVSNDGVPSIAQWIHLS